MNNYDFSFTEINGVEVQLKKTSELLGMVYRFENCGIRAENIECIEVALVEKLDSMKIPRSTYEIEVFGWYCKIKFFENIECFKKGFYDVDREIDTLTLYQDKW